MTEYGIVVTLFMSGKNKNKDFFNEIIHSLLNKNVGVKLVNRHSREVYYADGFFDCGNREIVCNITGPFDRWFPIFLHEYGHYLQWDEFCEEWQDVVDNNAYTVFFSWLKGDDNISKQEAHAACKKIRTLEQHCDNKVIDLIKKHDLNINIEQYAKQSNAYISGYEFMKERRMLIYKIPKEVEKYFSGEKLLKRFPSAESKLKIFELFETSHQPKLPEETSHPLFDLFTD